jgi:hypothetical protein
MVKDIDLRRAQPFETECICVRDHFDGAPFGFFAATGLRQYGSDRRPNGGCLSGVSLGLCICSHQTVNSA